MESYLIITPESEKELQSNIIEGKLVAANGRPIFYRELAEKRGLISRAMSATLDEALADPDLREIMVGLENVPQGYQVIPKKALEAAKQRPKEEPTHVEVVPDTFGYRILTRLPKEIWQQLDGRYWGEDELEEMDYFDAVPDWRYPRGAISKLLAAGYRVTIYGHEITEDSDAAIEAAIAAHRAEVEAERQAKAARNAQRAALAKRLRELFDNAEHPDSESCKQISRSKRLQLLGSKPQDIYGGGEWYHLSDTHFWWVRNNGADGDDWSINNYPTGGAGAIALRIARTPEVDSLLAEIEAFDGSKAPKPQPAPLTKPDRSNWPPTGRFVWIPKQGFFRGQVMVADRAELVKDDEGCQVEITPDVQLKHAGEGFQLWSDGLATFGKLTIEYERSKALKSVRKEIERLIKLSRYLDSRVRQSWRELLTVKAIKRQTLKGREGYNWELALHKLDCQTMTLYLVEGHAVSWGEDADIAEYDALFSERADAEAHYRELERMFAS